MTFLPILSPLGWAAVGVVPMGILLLYFLKLRREPVEVPSTFLWASTIEDLHVNALLQKLKRSLLLLLQLLAVALAIFALLRPGFRGETTETPRRIFLLDSSASMNARDVIDPNDEEIERSRFELAKQRIESEIEQMRDQETAMLITFDDRAKILQPFTTDRSRLRDALAAAKPSLRRTEILGALRAADGLANPRRTSQIGDTNDIQVADAKPADLIIHSDGGFDAVNEFSLGNLIPRYESVGTGDADNAAITAFSASRNVENPAMIEVFATVANFSRSAVQTTANLSSGDALLDAQTLSIPPDQQSAVSFTLQSDDAAQLQLAIDLDDDFATDNVAFAATTPMRTVKVLLVTSGNKPLELGLSTSSVADICQIEVVPPSFLQTEAYADRDRAGNDDLIVFDRCQPDSMPASNTFFIGELPPQGWGYTSEAAPQSIIDVDSSDPVLQYVQMMSLLIVQGRGVKGPTGTKDLVTADGGVVMAMATRDGYRDLVIGFDLISETNDGANLVNTNWYAEHSWPVFLLNVLRHLAGAYQSAAAMSYPPGTAIELRVNAGVDEITIRREGTRDRWTLNPGPSGLVQFVQTDQTGNYSVREGKREDGRLIQLFSVNLFDRSESRLAAKSEIDIGYESFEGVAGQNQSRREFWRPALFCMLGLLAAEWFLFGRRTG